jgi:hypothetical protein
MDLSRKQKIFSIKIERNDEQGLIIVSDENEQEFQINFYL